MKNNYTYLKQKLFAEDIGYYSTYGISSSDGKFMLGDVSCDENIVQRIVSDLNSHNVPTDSVKDFALLYL